MPERNVLVVDDDELVCWAIERTLLAHGLTPHPVGSADEARARVRAESFRLAFLDVHLPDANGLDLLHDLRSASPGMPVVILSCDASWPNKERAFAGGAWQFVEKPFELSEINRLLRTSFGDFPARRRHERYLCRLPVRIAVVESPGADASLPLPQMRGVLADVGPGGLRLRTEDALEPGQWVTTRPEGEEPSCARLAPRPSPAQVVWVATDEGGFSAGLRYAP